MVMLSLGTIQFFFFELARTIHTGLCLYISGRRQVMERSEIKGLIAKALRQS